jgi:hypothetical protein
MFQTKVEALNYMHKTDLSIPPSAVIKIVWDFTPTLTAQLHGMVFWHRDIVTFYLNDMKILVFYITY